MEGGVKVGLFSLCVCVCVRGLKRLKPSLAAVTREDPSAERSHCGEASSWAASYLHGSLSCSGNYLFSFLHPPSPPPLVSPPPSVSTPPHPPTHLPSERELPSSGVAWFSEADNGGRVFRTLGRVGMPGGRGHQGH